jgi:2-isopropylmalate synthase
MVRFQVWQTRFIRIDLDIMDYKEHAIGRGRGLKADSYVECIAASSIKMVWGVGVHEDVVESSLLAVLGAASNEWPPFPPALT